MTQHESVSTWVADDCDFEKVCTDKMQHATEAGYPMAPDGNVEYRFNNMSKNLLMCRRKSYWAWSSTKSKNFALETNLDVRVRSYKCLGVDCCLKCGATRRPYVEGCRTKKKLRLCLICKTPCENKKCAARLRTQICKEKDRLIMQHTNMHDHVSFPYAVSIDDKLIFGDEKSDCDTATPSKQPQNFLMTPLSLAKAATSISHPGTVSDKVAYASSTLFSSTSTDSAAATATTAANNKALVFNAVAKAANSEANGANATAKLDAAKVGASDKHISATLEYISKINENKHNIDNSESIDSHPKDEDTAMDEDTDEETNIVYELGSLLDIHDDLQLTAINIGRNMSFNFSFYTQFMKTCLVMESSVPYIVTDTTSGVFGSNELLTTSSIYVPVLKRWAPVLFTWSTQIDEELFKNHFMILISLFDIQRRSSLAEFLGSVEFTTYAYPIQLQGYLLAISYLFRVSLYDARMAVQNRQQDCKQQFSLFVSRVASFSQFNGIDLGANNDPPQSMHAMAMDLAKPSEKELTEKLLLLLLHYPLSQHWLPWWLSKNVFDQVFSGQKIQKTASCPLEIGDNFRVMHYEMLQKFPEPDDVAHAVEKLYQYANSIRLSCQEIRIGTIQI